MKKHVILLMIVIVLAKVGGFAKDMVLSYFYGASITTDAYVIALTIPNAILGLIFSSIASGFAPIYSDALKSYGPARANEFTSSILNFVLILCTAFMALVFIFTKPLVNIFASGFDAGAVSMAATFTRIYISAIYFIGIFYIFEAYLQMHNSYAAAGLMALPLNMLIILSIAISFRTNTKVLAIGSLAATSIQAIGVIVFAHLKGYRYQAIFDYKDPYLKKILTLIVPIIIGSSVYQVNQIIDKTLASQVAAGGITALNYAQKLNGFIKDIFVVSIATVLYPNITKMAALDNKEDFKKSIAAAINTISIIIIPASFGAMLFSRPIIDLLFSRGAFDNRAAAMTSDALLYYSIGMIGTGIRAVFTKTLYALKDTKTSVIVALIGMTINIVLNLILSRYMGIGGLALATSIASIIDMLIMFFCTRVKIGSFDNKAYLALVIKVLAASLTMCIISILLYNSLSSYVNNNLSLMIAIFTGAIIYFIIILHMRIGIIDEHKKALIQKLLALVSRKGAADYDLIIDKELSHKKYILTDFSEYQTGHLPLDWTLRWCNDVECRVQGDNIKSNSKMIRMDVKQNCFNNKLISWNKLDNYADLHIRARVRNREAREYQAWITVRGNGTASNPSGYILVLSAHGLETISFLDGSYEFHCGCSYNWAADTWYWLDFVVKGDSLQGKVWMDGAIEPEDYQITTSSSRISQGGWVGFGGQAPGYHDCNYFYAEIL